MATSVARQIAAVRKSAERMDAAAPAVIGEVSPGDVVRQGDLYLVRLEYAPQGNPLRDRQLAPGSTQGSRHVACGDCRILDCDKATLASTVNRLSRSSVPAELVGPVVECVGATDITHPEHGNRLLPAGSVWAVVFQRAFADTIRRQQD